ncbi:CAP domain-containing protein [Streptomyces sp. NPDC001594]|uniref:CAP domain-containing protein n=1 Tax=Streptomyces sp. NPDC001594 TaxID=3364590 RepID=UPI0036A82A14
MNAAHRESIPRTPSAATAAAAKLVDEARAEAGCEPLTVDPALAALAAGHSKDMALDGYFGHQGPDGAPLVVRAARSGAPAATAENIARGPADPQALMNMWMARPGARANILNCGFHSMGLGAYFNGSGFWWTGDFAA